MPLVAFAYNANSKPIRKQSENVAVQGLRAPIEAESALLLHPRQVPAHQAPALLPAGRFRGHHA